jgi:transposase-like protein
MTKPIARDSIYRGRVFNAEIIELCVRWYITYRLSYRDLVGMMAERGVVGGSQHNPATGNPVRAGI